MRLQLAIGCSLLALAPCLTAWADEDLRVASDTLIYTDTDNVVVITPQVSIGYALDDDGGNLGARVAVDAITAASVDVVSQATQSFSEIRTEVGLSASKRLLGKLPSLSYRYSSEPDYVSHGGRAGLSTPLGSKDTTLSGGFGITFDRIGRSDTPPDAFSEKMTTQSFDISLTQVLGPKTLIRGAYTLTLQNGYLEKPYRHVPLFRQMDIDQAAADGVALGINTFDDYALPYRPPESVPDDRARHALAFRLMRFLPSWKTALRLDYQLYTDSWGVWSNMLEPSAQKRFGQKWVARTFVRLYHQTSADFWRKIYVTGDNTVPRYRTIDRSLSRYLSTSTGFRVEWSPWELVTYIDAQVMRTAFAESLFIDSRTALIGQVGIQWTP